MVFYVEIVLIFMMPIQKKEFMITNYESARGGFNSKIRFD